MATIIKLKRGSATPTTSDLANGEVGIDTSAKKFYINDSGTIKEIGGGTGGGDSFYSTFGTGRNTDTSAATVSVSGSVGGTSLSTPTIASHSHNVSPSGNNRPSGGGVLQGGVQGGGSYGTSSAGGGGSHSHPFSVSSSSLGGTISVPAMNIKYANVIVAAKD